MVKIVNIEFFKDYLFMNKRTGNVITVRLSPDVDRVSIVIADDVKSNVYKFVEASRILNGKYTYIGMV